MAKKPASKLPSSIRLRLSAGRHAVNEKEAEVRVNGARIAGGTGTFEFDLLVETWVDIVVMR